MRPFSEIRADGTRRFRAPPAQKPTPAQQRSKRANGVLALSGNSARGRRLRELVRIYSTGVDPDDEKAAALVRSTASIALKVEQLEDASDAGEPIDALAFNRLVNTRERNLRRLNELRRLAAPPGAPAAEAEAGLAALRRFLDRLARQGGG
jgi:hypothetical protein